MESTTVLAWKQNSNSCSSGAAPAFFDSGTLSDTSSVSDDNFSGAALIGLGSRAVSSDELNNQSLVAVYHNDYQNFWIAEYGTSLYAHPWVRRSTTNDITWLYAPHQQLRPARENWPDMLLQSEPDKERPRSWPKPGWLSAGEGIKMHAVFKSCIEARLRTVSWQTLARWQTANQHQ